MNPKSVWGSPWIAFAESAAIAHIDRTRCQHKYWNTRVHGVQECKNRAPFWFGAGERNRVPRPGRSTPSRALRPRGEHARRPRLDRARRTRSTSVFRASRRLGRSRPVVRSSLAVPNRASRRWR